mmetsp:Transcript_8147/g.20418  ORF Transcript_8147/g.20418 Transcript_8147/m.20418 type:complete len:267 (+) Transcript_8147:241-1041(+)
MGLLSDTLRVIRNSCKSSQFNVFKKNSSESTSHNEDRIAGSKGSNRCKRENASLGSRPHSVRFDNISMVSDSSKCNGSIIRPLRRIVLQRAPSSPSKATCNVTPNEKASVLKHASVYGSSFPPREGTAVPNELRLPPMSAPLGPLHGTVIISGGKNPTVPHMVIRSADVTTFAKPKSVSFASSLSEMRMFSGFTSLYTMRSFMCKCVKASTTWPMYFATTGGDSPGHLPESSATQIKRFKSVGHNSNSNAKYLGVWKARSRRTMKG